MGSPRQLTRAQTAELKTIASGKPILAQKVTVKSDGKFTRTLELRENDVYLLQLELATGISREAYSAIREYNLLPDRRILVVLEWSFFNSS